MSKVQTMQAGASAAPSAPPADQAERRRALLETAAVAGGLQAYSLWLRPSLAVDGLVLLAVLVVVMTLFRRRRETPRTLGITDRAGAAAAVPLLVPILACLAAGAVALRWLAEPSEPVPWAALALSIATYPLWGLLQQLFYCGFVLRGAQRAGAPRVLAIVIGGGAYALIHAPNWPLVGVCLPLGLALAWVYARTRGLIPIAVVHGIGGALAIHVIGLDLEVGAPYEP